jgi:hypothetical protein
MDYKNVQCIGFQINTFPEHDYIYNLLLSKWEIQRSRYLGILNDDTDIRARCSLMRDAIAFADKQSDIDRDEKRLKLFVAPEFFFRGTKGAYPIEKVSMIMESLRGFTAQPRFADWLFVLGTALGQLENLLDTEIFNIALVQKGGVKSSTYKQGEQDAFVVYKEYVSHIDFLRDKAKNWQNPIERVVNLGNRSDLVQPTLGSRDISAFGGPASGVVKDQYGNQHLKEVNKTGLGGGSIFTIGGITFGIEVCLDHFKRRLRQAERKKGDPRVQVQVVPSAGMSIDKDSIAVVEKGLIFNVDGGGGAAHTALKELTLGVFDLVSDVKAKSTKDVAYYGANAGNYRKLFQETGKIVIYPAAGLPKPEVW